jgi:putative endonuclease
MTENLIQRLDHHNHPINGFKYTARGIPWELFLSIPCESKNHAARLERLIKAKKSRVFIQNLERYPELVNKITWEAKPDC